MGKISGNICIAACSVIGVFAIVALSCVAMLGLGYGKAWADSYTITYHAGELGGTFEDGTKTITQPKEAGVDAVISDVIPCGTGSGPASIVRLDPCGGTIVDEAESYMIGYITENKFASWNTKEDGSGTEYKIGSDYTEDADLDLWAYCTSETTNDSSILPNAVRDGFVFDGWYDHETGNRVGGAGEQIPLDNWVQILDAHWVAVETPAVSDVAASNTTNSGTETIAATGDMTVGIAVLLVISAVGVATADVLRRKHSR